jgi:hypothetical protein
VGNQLTNGINSRVLDEGRITTINKRQRIDDDFICDSTPYFKMRRLNNQNLFRQYNSLKVHHKRWGNQFISLARLGNKDPIINQQAPFNISVSTCAWNNECGSRQTQQGEEASLRINNTKENLQSNHQAMEVINNRCVCSTSQPSTTNILEYSAGPLSSSNRCVSTTMVTKRDVPKSPVEANTACSTNNINTTTTASSTSDAVVTQPILVSHATETATPGLPNYHANEQEVVSSRMEITNQTRVSLGIEDITAQFLQNSIRPTTKKA